MVALLYYISRGAQIVGMYLLLVDIVTAGPAGPNPRLFYIGIAVFLAGWALNKAVKR